MRHQVPRGTLPDAETTDALYLFKNVRGLRATYQIRLLLYRALKERRKLIIRVPNGCKLDTDLSTLRKEQGRTLFIEEV